MNQLQSDLNDLAEKIKELVKDFESSHEVIISDINLIRVDISSHTEERSHLAKVICESWAKGSNKYEPI